MTEVRGNKKALIGFLSCVIGSVMVLLFGRWQPRADFDVAGFLWLMQNVLPLTIFSILLAAASGALVVWIQSVRRHK